MTTSAVQAGVEIYCSDALRARFVDLGSERVIVAFPDRVHPANLKADGWGEAFLSSRNLSAVYITLAQIDWYQGADFFDMLAAIRAHLGPDRPLTTYGSSMGGYGALLAAKTLGADMCFAMVPQYSIDPKVVPFERRYKSEFTQIGTFSHDLDTQACPSCQYVLAFDPTHASDKKHAALIERSFQTTRLPIYGAGHSVIVYLIEVGAHAALAQFLAGDARLGAVRQSARAGRATSQRYLRRMSNKAREAGHENLVDFAQFAEERGLKVLAKRIRRKGRPVPTDSRQNLEAVETERGGETLSAATPSEQTPGFSPIDAEILRQIDNRQNRGLSRFAKGLLSGGLVLDASRLNEKKVAFARKQARRMRWNKLHVPHTAQAAYTEAEFNARVQDLRQQTHAFLASLKSEE